MNAEMTQANATLHAELNEGAITPEIIAEEIPDGVEITIKDKTGTQVVRLYNGADGAGIESVEMNADYTLTITLSDGDSYTTPPIRGPQGDSGAPGQDGSDGADGTTFTPSVAQNGDLSWTNDGGKVNPQTVNIKGPQGDSGAPGQDGADGVGIESVTLNQDYTLTITLTDETSYTTSSIRGAQGAPGQDGADGQNGQAGSDGDDGITFTPSVSSAGVISWTNDGQKPNPQSVDIVAAVLAALPTWTGGTY